MSNIVYTRLESPLELVANKDKTSEWYLSADSDPMPINTIEKATSFVAAGKAQRTDGDKACYYMKAEDFGSAETTGVPAHGIGVNTVDLSLAEANIGTESQPGAETPTGALDEPTEPISNQETESEEHQVPVRVIPPNPLKWQKSYVANLGTVAYTANGDYAIKDIAGEKPDAQIVRGMIVPIAGYFEKDGVKYLRTEQSVVNNSWYGVLPEYLSRGDEVTDDLLDDIFASTDDELREKLDLGPRETAIKAGATAKGTFERFFSFGKKKI